MISWMSAQGKYKSDPRLDAQEKNTAKVNLYVHINISQGLDAGEGVVI